MTLNVIYRWHEGALLSLDYSDMSETLIEVADSWLVTDGSVLALDLHRRRFLDGIEASGHDLVDAAGFWDATITAIPRTGDWFPRVELQQHAGSPLLVFRLRPAPERSRQVTLITHTGDDPRHRATVKGPALNALMRLRTEAQARGADEAVILSPLGHVVEGTTSALLWWRGDVLCSPAPELDRVDSVTARSVIALATALGLDISWEVVEPSELDGLEVWAANALHGLRIVTRWIDGPSTAEKPGRLGEWRARLDGLRRPMPE